MEDLATLPADAPSTTIDTETQTGSSGGGTPRLTPDTDAKPEKVSLRDTISAVVKEGGEDKAEAKADAKESAKESAKDLDQPAPKAEPKPTDDTNAEEKRASERGADGKFVARTKPEGGAAPEAETAKADQAEPSDKPADTKHYPDPPKSFQADSRELYRNVPRPVRRDIDIMVRTHEAELQQARQSSERYESIRPFDELARSNGRDLRESLVKINNVENALQRDPIYGLNEILKEIGPRKADGSPVSIYEMAQHIVSQGPDSYNQRMQMAHAAQPPAPDPRLQQTQQQLNEAHERLVTLQVIEPFKAEHPRYDELQEPIARILQSGMISPSLSAPERLEAAYVMAERLVPPSSHPAETDPAPAPTPTSRAADSLNGSKSIRSAPGSVSGDVEVERGGTIRDVLRDEYKRMKVR